MKIKPVYEFLVWDNCNNNCKFCFQRENPILFDHSGRKMVLDETINFIKSDKFIKGSHILICGGEIFDKPRDFEILDDFFCKILKFMVDGTVDLLYINTNLIYKDLLGVDRLLQRIRTLNLFDRLRFTTSYDLEGRFKSKEDEELMLSNLRLLSGIYKDLKVVTNTILTKQVCEKILDGTFNPKHFCDSFRCDINLIPYIVYTKELSASREQIFKALLKTNDLIDGYFKRYTNNLTLKQDKLLYKYNKLTKRLEFVSCGNSECGHSENFKLYSEDKRCFICDLIELNNMLGD